MRGDGGASRDRKKKGEGRGEKGYSFLAERGGRLSREKKGKEILKIILETRKKRRLPRRGERRNFCFQHLFEKLTIEGEIKKRT